MRIAIDANPLVNNHATHGIGRTTRRLIEELGRHPRATHDLSLAYYLPDYGWPHPEDWPHLRLRLLEPGEDFIRTAAGDGADLVHVMDYLHPLYKARDVPAPEHRPFRLVVTVRDIIPYHFPEQKRQGLLRLKDNLAPLLEVADHIIAISSATRDDLVKTLGVPPETITVIHHGVDHGIFHPDYDKESVLETVEAYGLSRPYLIYVAALDVRKNHGMLLDALYYLGRARHLRCDLVLIGTGRMRPQLEAHVRRLGLREQVAFLTDVPTSDLARLYRGAAVMAFPSLYEGFGNPVLEAMACGTPVVALRRSSIPELTGSAAILVRDGTYGTFGEALAEVLLDKSRARELRSLGLDRAAVFTWNRAAEETLAVYDRLLA